MTTLNIEWTKPFHGVQHVKLPHRNNQITLIKYSECCYEVYQLNLGSLHPFTDVCRERTKTLESATEYGEKWAKACL